METAMAAKRIVIEVGDERLASKILMELDKLGVKAYVEPDPDRVKERILERWKKMGRRAKPGELRVASLEEEFD
jgi:pantothenate kinase